MQKQGKKSKGGMWIKFNQKSNLSSKEIDDKQAYAEHVIDETHDAWKRLIQGKIPAKADTHDISVYVCVFPLLIDIKVCEEMK